MLRIIKINDSRYDRYEALLIERDNLRKDCDSIQITYFREFGDLLSTSFAGQIACIRLKKEIAWCQSYINRGQAIDVDQMHDMIEKTMSDYQRKLDDMYAETEAARSSIASDPATVIAVKRLYRQIAKKIHPDINPKTNEIKTLQELWQRVVAAYHANALDELRELDVMVSKALADCGDERVQIDIPDIEDKIAALEKQIDEIRSTNPYQYQYLLADDELVRQKKEGLKKEIASYDEYRKELEGILDRIMDENGISFRWKID